MKKHTVSKDFRAHVFTATGDITDLERFGVIDFFDNAVLEIDRLTALVELLDAVGSRDDDAVLRGAALLLRDIRSRLDLLVRTLGRMHDPSQPRLRKKR